MPRMVCRVVCGRFDVIATFAPTSALVSVDLPVFGLPTKQTKPERNSVMLSVAPRLREDRSVAILRSVRSHWAARLGR